LIEPLLLLPADYSPDIHSPPPFRRLLLMLMPRRHARPVAAPRHVPAHASFSDISDYSSFISFHYFFISFLHFIILFH
jgi:hypothetical protein